MAKSQPSRFSETLKKIIKGLIEKDIVSTSGPHTLTRTHTHIDTQTCIHTSHTHTLFKGPFHYPALIGSPESANLGSQHTQTLQG